MRPQKIPTGSPAARSETPVHVCTYAHSPTFGCRIDRRAIANGSTLAAPKPESLRSLKGFATERYRPVGRFPSGYAGDGPFAKEIWHDQPESNSFADVSLRAAGARRMRNGGRRSDRSGRP